jgi:hypothetical protein
MRRALNRRLIITFPLWQSSSREREEGRERRKAKEKTEKRGRVEQAAVKKSVSVAIRRKMIYILGERDNKDEKMGGGRAREGENWEARERREKGRELAVTLRPPPVLLLGYAPRSTPPRRRRQTCIALWAQKRERKRRKRNECARGRTLPVSTRLPAVPKVGTW